MGRTEKGETYYHYSDTPISSFAPICTAFWTERKSWGHCYSLIPPPGTEVEVYLSGEVRIELRVGWYLSCEGEVEMETIRDENGWVTGYKINKNSLTPRSYRRKC